MTDYKEELEDLLKLKSGLTDWEVRFIDSCHRQLKFKSDLSEKQQDRIRKIWWEKCK